MGTDEPFADIHLLRDVPTFAEVRIQNTSLVGGTVLNLAGPSDVSADGAIVQYSNASGLLQIKNRFASPSVASIVIDTQQARAITIAPDGKVGIGAIAGNSNESLTVVGNISATGSIFAPMVQSSTLNIDRINANSIGTNTMTVSTVNANLVNAQRVVADSVMTKYLSSQKTFIVWDTATVQAQPTTLLSISANDIELVCNSDVTVFAFGNGRKGATYTLTNVSTFVVTITSSPTVFVRTGHSWRSNTSSLSTAFLKLLPGHSCSVRAANNNTVSIW